MRKPLTALMMTGWLLGAAWAQAPDIRNPDIGEDPQGQMLTDAGISEDTAQKITILSTFVERYASDANIGYAYFQLQILNLEAQDFAKAAQFSEKLLAIVPNDLEVRHNAIRAYEGAGVWDKLLPLLIETKPMAEKQGDEYAQGVLQYLEYSLITSVFKITDPKVKLSFLGALRKDYPNGQYANSPAAVDAYVLASQQLGQMDNAIPIMQAALDASPDNPNEAYLYMMAEHALGKREDAKAKALGQRLVDVMPKKAKPDNVSAEQWEQQKGLFTAYGYFVLGRLSAMTEDYKTARDHLTKAVGPMEKQGGQPYGTLAYFLGICYVKLDVAGDNIPQATKWMGAAAQTENPFQAEAKKTLAAIKQAQ
jgi:tetratricopeptide (TPR) repeat protein